MPRTKAPPWVRWIGQDGHASAETIRGLVVDVLAGLVDGQRRDETIRQLKRIEQEAAALNDGFIQLQNVPSIEQVVDWVMDDETVLTLVQARLVRH